MKRRDLIKSLAIVPAISLVPSIAEAKLPEYVLKTYDLTNLVFAQAFKYFLGNRIHNETDIKYHGNSLLTKGRAVTCAWYNELNERNISIVDIGNTQYNEQEIILQKVYDSIVSEDCAEYIWQYLITENEIKSKKYYFDFRTSSLMRDGSYMILIGLNNINTGENILSFASKVRLFSSKDKEFNKPYIVSFIKHYQKGFE